MRHILITIAAAWAAAGLAGCVKTASGNDAGEASWATLNGEAPLVIAHRGASGYLPEHTIEAYALAIEQGADIIEPDLVVTKDGALIARHDRYLSSTTNVSDKPDFAGRKRPDPDPNGTGREDWWVEDFTLAEIRTLRARQPRESRPQEHNDRYAIPTFEEVLTLAAAQAQERGRAIGVYPETKHPGHFESIGLDFEAPLIAALDGFNAGPVFIQSFEPDILKRLKGKTPHKLVQLVYEETPGAGPNIPLADIAIYADGVGPSKNVALSGLAFPPQNAETPFIQEAHDLNLFVHPWTFRNDDESTSIAHFAWDTHYLVREDGAPMMFDDPSSPETEYEFYFRLGVDGVFTDFPDTAVHVRDAIKADAP